MRPPDEIEEGELNDQKQQGQIPPEQRRPLGRVLDLFAAVAAGFALTGSLITSIVFRLAGASDMSVGRMLVVALGVSVGIYLIILLGGRRQEKNL